MTRILHLTSYPTRPPRHGGQIRASHTARMLEAAGCTVERMAVFSRSQHLPDSEPPAVDLDAARAEGRFPGLWQVRDLTTSELAATDTACFEQFVRRAEAARADIVMLEEPWLWPAVRRWGERGSPAPPVIYNAHNIESRSKAAILAESGVAEAAGIVEEVAALEQDLARNAAAASATTTDDAATIAGWTGRPVAVAANGTVLRRVGHLHGILPEPLEPWHSYLLFVGSAHAPNATGFCDLVLPGLSVLRAGQLIVVAGRVGELIRARLEGHELSYLARDRIVLLGAVGELALSSLLGNARGVLLPITYGGGSNLKTPEALVSGLPVLGTSCAFRGFERYAGLPGVAIADDPAAFAAGMRALLATATPAAPLVAPQDLLWDSTLQPIVALVRALAPAR